jgi:hypothetical protein
MYALKAFCAAFVSFGFVSANTFSLALVSRLSCCSVLTRFIAAFIPAVCMAQFIEQTDCNGLVLTNSTLQILHLLIAHGSYVGQLTDNIVTYSVFSHMNCVFKRFKYGIWAFIACLKLCSE